LGIDAFRMKPLKQSDLLDAIVGVVATSESEETEIDLTPAPGEPGRRLRVLLAEDNAVNQRLAARVLQKQGHTVVIAGNGRTALEAVARELFDVVLMDVQMPDMNGFEATAAIRAREQITRRRTPIIALTAHAMKGDRERCLEAGMDAYVTKPIRSDELFAAIAAVVRGAEEAFELEDGSGPVMDLTAAKQDLYGDESLLREIAGLFLQEMPSMASAIDAALEAGDCRALADAAHSVKGSISQFRAEPGRRAAEHLEALARAGNLTDAMAASRTLAAELSRLAAALRGLEPQATA